MSLAFYKPTGGFFERAHPAMKILCLILAFLPPFFTRGPLEALPYLILLFAVALISGCAPNLRRVAPIMAILFVMSVALWSLFHKGQTIVFSLGPIALTKEGALYGIMIGIRLSCFILSALIFLTSTRIEDFTYGLSWLGLPFPVSFALSLAFRLTPLFIETGQTIVMAQKARGLNLDSGGPLARIRRYVLIIIPVLVSGLRRADQLAIALESKGFGYKSTRTCLSDHRLTWRDLVLVSGIFAVDALAVMHYCWV
ncbi:MAG: energy-coupling factor transporter transmembrane component T [Candidatus Sumerlaeota bacterium]|nr:energy-coupling factor transporter transmembrane component T [Candidatus Sumerlaeota bacterium]